MNKEKQIEEMQLTEVDILANDINTHCIDLSQTFCGGTSCTSCLAHALTEKGYRKASEVAEEIISEIEEIFEIGYGGVYEFKKLLAELKKKYTEADNDQRRN